MTEMEKYKEALRRILHIDLGIYPASIQSGPNAYAERSGYQNGWNAALIQQSTEEERILKELGIDYAELD